MPALYILPGPNGAGKTTYYNTAVEQGFIDPSLPFINVDNIAKIELGGYTQENFAKADAIARVRIASFIQNEETFMIESNLAKASDYEWIEKMIKRGYEAILYFLGTADIDVNKNRVKKRVKEGGHDIPESIIEHRYKMGLSYLKSKLLIFKEAYLIDNSRDIAREVVSLKDCRIIEKSEDCPKWAVDVLYIIERLNERNSQ